MRYGKSILIVLLVNLMLGCTAPEPSASSLDLVPSQTLEVVDSPEPPVDTTLLDESLPRRSTSEPEAVVTLSAPSEPLSADGPWLLYFSESAITISEIDGLNLVTFSLPIERWANYDLGRQMMSPTHRQLAIPVVVDSGEYEIWIFSLPHLELIQNLPVNINTNESSYSLRSNLLRRNIYTWSPDGRYLAYLANRVGIGSSLYLYDTQDSSIEQLTDSSEYVHIMGWSPDGSHVAYVTASDFDEFGYVPEAIRAINIYTGDVEEMEHISVMDNPIFQEFNYGWISNEEMVVASYVFEGRTHDLRVLSLDGGVRRIGASFHCSASIVADLHMAYLNLCEFKGAVPSIGIGIYRFNLSDDSLHLIHAGGLDRYLGHQWIPQLEVLIVDEYAEDRIFVYDYLGNKLAEFPGRWVSTSPDGQWLLVRDEDIWNLYDYNFNFIRVIAGKDATSVTWLPDSSGFLNTEDTGKLHFYSIDPTEENMLIDLGKEFREFFIVQP